MRLTISKKIGKNNFPFTFEGKNLFDVVMDSQKLSFGDLKACGLCGSDNLRLTAYETEKDKYKYVKVVCNECRGTLTMGRSKTDQDSFFYRKNDSGKFDWVAYIPKGSTPIRQKIKESVFTGAVDETQIGDSIDTIVPF